MSSVPGQSGSRKSSSWLFPSFGYGISLACLVWVYWGFDWKAELPRFAAANWRWVTVAVVADVAVYFIQGWRWSLLLSPIVRVPFSRSVQAVYVGLFANEVLPLRSGELIRCYVLAKWTDTPFSVMLSSAVVERLFDGAWLVIGFFIVSPFLDLPGYLIQGTRILATALIVVAILLGVVMFLKHHAHAAVSSSRWSAALWHVVEGLHGMGNSPSFYMAFLVSLGYLAFQIVPVYVLMVGYGLDLSFGVAAVVLIVLRLGTVLPQAPGNVGAFQFFTVMALRLFGVDRATAIGFATMMFVVVTVPLWLAGLVAVAMTGMKIRDLQHHAQRTFRTSEETAAGSEARR
jgi:glycosyltransferase 2 family protein